MFVRPVYWSLGDLRNDKELASNENGFMLGDSLLVCANFSPPPNTVSNCVFPRGLWCSLLKDECIDVREPEALRVEIDNEFGLELLQKQGTIVPMAAEVENTIEQVKFPRQNLGKTIF